MARWTCPNCGYKTKMSQTEYYIMINNMLRQESAEMKKIITKLLKEIETYYPITKQEMAGFVYMVLKIERQRLKFILRNIYLDKKILQKGLPYIKKVIQNYDVVYDKKKEYERKIYGTLPPKIELED